MKYLLYAYYGMLILSMIALIVGGIATCFTNVAYPIFVVGVIGTFLFGMLGEPFDKLAQSIEESEGKFKS